MAQRIFGIQGRQGSYTLSHDMGGAYSIAFGGWYIVS